MEGLNIVDLLVLIIVLLSGTLAYFRGLVRESISIAGWIISALLAFNFANQVEPMLRSAPLIGEYLQKSCDISIILTFVLLFTVCLVIFSILAPFLSSVIKRTYLKSIDRFFGFLFGLARGALIIIVLFITYNQFNSISENMKIVEKSQSDKVLSLYQDQINQFIPEGILESVSKQYEELTFICKAYN